MKENLNIKLKEIRIQRGLSQTDVANYLGISRQSISQWENGKGYLDIENFVLLSRLYNVSVDVLLGVDSSTTEVLEEKENEEVVLKK